ncbi:MAG: T9SS type A sorting domain-containing protein [Flavobacteriales bacterium]
MQKIINSGLFAFLSAALYAQPLPQLGFERKQNIPVKINQETIQNPWTGGMNFCQFSEIDLDMDGKKDLFVFDRSGNKVMTFINHGETGEINYRHAPEYKSSFPEMMGFALLRDYNCDGKEDIFTYGVAGFKVFKNISTPETGLAFELVTDDLKSKYGNFDVSIYVIPIDVPALVDVDGDGDLDLLVFSILGQCVEYHRNMALEETGNCNELRFRLETGSWGNFVESFNTNEVFLNDSCNSFGANDPGPLRHAGSTLLAIDMDDDGDLDLMLGDIAYRTMLKLLNGGTPEQANIVQQVHNFPQGTNPVNIDIFPAGYYLDINNDGVKDLIVCPNSESGSENFRSIWLYRNNGQNSLPNFQYVQNDFLLNETIDLGEGAYPIFVDINRDGLLDMLVGNFGYFASGGYVPQIAYFQNIGTATEPVFELINRNFGSFSAFAGSTVSFQPTCGDLDDDGDPDLIIGLSDGRLYYFENIAAPGQMANFTLSSPFYQNIDVGTFAAPHLVDIDRDGLLDLLIGDRTGRISYYRNTGSAFQAAFTLVTNNWGNVDVSAEGEFEGFAAPFIVQRAGKHHLYVGSRSGAVFYYGDVETGNPETFTLLQNDLFGRLDGLRSKPAFSDINGDGLIDAMVGYFNGGLVYYEGKVPIGITEVKGNLNLMVYPNPASDFLFYHIEPFLPETKITIHDLRGRKCYNASLHANQGQLSLDSIKQAGIYILSVENTKGKAYLRFVKK